MREINRYWTVRGVRKHLCIRFWYHGNPLRSLWNYLTGKHWWATPVDWWFFGRRENGQCYCPTGRMQTFRLEVFGCGFFGWLSRDPTPRPCVCTKVCWLLHWPDDAEDIEDYGGLEKLRAEMPDVKPIDGEFPT
jgi:hypothetical protein